MPATPHPALAPLGALVGTWVGQGEGHFPTIEPFAWRERMEVAASPKPVLAFRQRTTTPDGSAPMHAEDGWVRVLPDGPEDACELVVAQPTGLVEAHAGTWVRDGDALVLDWTSGTVAGTPSAVTVLGTRRRWVLREDLLVVDLWMATEAVVDLTHHLTAHLRREA